MTDMTHPQTTTRSTPMPEAMRVLLQDYPRDSWQAHPGFHENTRHWLGAHQMFRQLGELVQREAETYLDKGRSDDTFAAHLSYYGDALVRNLHGHHGWEDHSYFPELCAADPRFEAGLEILEQDHADLDAVLDRFTRAANRTIQLIQLDPAAVRAEVGGLHTEAKAINAFLARHLGDEEDLAVPIILHHRLRG
ncbi:hemerythrin domain-containing protein [Aliiroseovarius lamellibrachiae]|uniref:hemerythrin domain-containing protein n=1 Tax=Aliiroseovarius lamellibrachiae TaxID=1924933 RepID=UPI001FE6976A|nr:hemerythrin domain-containing protein [Aliiroseovarius lamellibrachiae]